MLLRTLVLAAVLAAPAFAAEPQVYRLSPEQVEAAKNQASQVETNALIPEPSRTEIGGPSLYGDETKPKRAIHGEMGVVVGTGGTRGIFGTAIVPLGENSTAAFSFSQGQGRGYGYGGFGGYGGYGGYGSPYGYSPYGSPYYRQPGR